MRNYVNHFHMDDIKKVKKSNKKKIATISTITAVALVLAGGVAYFLNNAPFLGGNQSSAFVPKTTKKPVTTEQTFVSVTKTTAPATKTTAPVTKTTAPATKTTVPVTKTTVPTTTKSVTKTTAPVTKTTAPTTIKEETTTKPITTTVPITTKPVTTTVATTTTVPATTKAIPDDNPIIKKMLEPVNFELHKPSDVIILNIKDIDVSEYVTKTWDFSNPPERSGYYAELYEKYKVGYYNQESFSRSLDSGYFLGEYFMFYNQYLIMPDNYKTLSVGQKVEYVKDLIKATADVLDLPEQTVYMDDNYLQTIACRDNQITINSLEIQSGFEGVYQAITLQLFTHYKIKAGAPLSEKDAIFLYDDISFLGDKPELYKLNGAYCAKGYSERLMEFFDGYYEYSNPSGQIKDETVYASNDKNIQKVLKNN